MQVGDKVVAQIETSWDPLYEEFKREYFHGTVVAVGKWGLTVKLDNFLKDPAIWGHYADHALVAPQYLWTEKEWRKYGPQS